MDTRRTDNTNVYWTREGQTINIMDKRRTDNIKTKQKTDNIMDKRRTDNIMAMRRRQYNGQEKKAMQWRKNG